VTNRDLQSVVRHFVSQLHLHFGMKKPGIVGSFDAKSDLVQGDEGSSSSFG